MMTVESQEYFVAPGPGEEDGSEQIDANEVSCRAQRAQEQKTKSKRRSFSPYEHEAHT